jgi:mannose-1-phosphate guanylyltransferase / mannose-6-phosphate isomerase
MSDSLIHPVILSGGAGTRLWPASRDVRPKQFMSLTDEHSLLQNTMLRFHREDGFAHPVIVGADEHNFLIAGQAEVLELEMQALLLEPMPRDTALAAACAAAWLDRNSPRSLMLVMPADHAIANPAVLLKAIRSAIPAALGGWLVTFGIRPDRPETGYGYVESSDSEVAPGVLRASSFTEKPDRKTAAKYLSGGRHHWNSGIFLFRADVLLDQLKLHAGDIANAAHAAVSGSRRDGATVRLDRAAFEAVRPISLDYAVMQTSESVAVTPVEGLGWSDVGTWHAVHAAHPHDGNGNVTVGDVELTRCANTLAYLTDGRILVGLGLSDLVVVSTPDAVLVARRDLTADLKTAVERLPGGKGHRVASQSRFERPWGHYECLHEGDRHQVKHIFVKPGGQLSLQKHYHRAEHWIVVRGTGLVTRGNEVLQLTEDETVYLPLGIHHRLENPGRIPLSLIEVQTGSYLGEDDIERFHDHYGRA